MNRTSLQKLIVILGSTASGKTEWGLRLAKEFSGEIISADSRQIYKYMDIGTAKPAGEWRWHGLRRTFFVDDVPHHLVDFLNPGKIFTVVAFRDLAIKYIKMADRNNHMPFLVGGTGLYISALVDNWHIPRVQPNKKLRNSFEEKTNEELMRLLSTIDPDTAASIDTKNKRRIIRALEVSILSGESFSKQRSKGEPLFDILYIGIDVPKETLYQRIDLRIDRMIEDGLLAEVAGLVQKKYGWHLSSMNGIGYRQFRGYFEGVLGLDHAVALLKRDTRHFAKRQRTWFRRDKRIQWYATFEQAHDAVVAFLQS